MKNLSANLHTDFISEPMLWWIRKDVLPPHDISSVIYYFKCQRDTDYIDRTRGWKGKYVPPNINKKKQKKRQRDNSNKCTNTSDLW